MDEHVEAALMIAGAQMKAKDDEIARLRAELAAERESSHAEFRVQNKCIADQHDEIARLLDLSTRQAAELELLRQVWEDTRTQRDELMAHIKDGAPLPEWAAKWIAAL